MATRRERGLVVAVYIFMLWLRFTRLNWRNCHKFANIAWTKTTGTRWTAYIYLFPYVCTCIWETGTNSNEYRLGETRPFDDRFVIQGLGGNSKRRGCNWRNSGEFWRTSVLLPVIDTQRTLFCVLRLETIPGCFLRVFDDPKNARDSVRMMTLGCL